MVYDFMLVLFGQSAVGWQFIGEDCRARLDMLFNACLKFRLAAIVNRHGANCPSALHHSECDSFIGHAVPIFLCAALAFLVHIAGLPADEGFIAFNLSPEFSAEVLILHSKANPVQQEPCRLLGDPYSAMEF